ncbi:BQ5605_C005g03225 [Microbotryum silenes-dioicae]|uniref:BQ5605_C005g03225 protein n=1 Tax=Microbotryum silenes-dioicae TaxID=796604 RepID=A0A2X0MA38_9BASI|nr:BQ5605_C005g03225 [Microbotryum silenes-dioicae]
MSYMLPPSAYPRLDPPLLTRLPRPPRVANPYAQPASKRFADTLYPTLQDKLDQLDYLEEQHLSSMHEIRSFGFSWLVPLGRQNTQEEDLESTYSNSPPPGSPPLISDTDGALATGAQIDEVMADVAEVDLDAEIEDADQAASSASEDDVEDEEAGANADLEPRRQGGENQGASPARSGSPGLDSPFASSPEVSTDAGEGEGDLSEVSMDI